MAQELYTNLSEEQLLDECIHQAEKAQRLDWKVPQWLWPFIMVAGRRLEAERGVSFRYEPNHYLVVRTKGHSDVRND